MKTLLQPAEITRLASISDTLPRCTTSEILETEESEFFECLGEDLRRTLLENLTDLSSAVDYASGSYNEGAIVKYNDGLYYTAQENTSTEPGSSAWSLTDKFQDGKANELWCNYLGRYLALGVVRDSLIMISTNISAKGVVLQKDQDFEPASDERLRRVQKDIMTKMKRIFRSMDRWLKEHNSGMFAGYLGNQSTGCDDDSDNCDQYTSEWLIA